MTAFSIFKPKSNFFTLINNKIKVVVNGTTFSTVYTNKDGDERATFFNEEIKAENEIKENA